MSSPNSSSSGTGGRSRSRLRLRSSRIFSWGAAAGTAVALYGFPFALVATRVPHGRWAVGLLVLDLLVLVAVAIWLWSPLVVLGALVVTSIGAVVFWVGAVLSETCGHSSVAAVVEPVGALLLALPLATWGVRRGAHMLWAIPAGYLAAGLWIVVCAQVIPGAAGSCVD
jgi:hypothetical protein